MQFKNKPKVAAFMVTYNQVRFIAQAIEGVLMQQTDFPVKLFIGEDCSSDGTREICQRYAEKYPERIELLFAEKNMGGVANAQRVYPVCFSYGDYTAMCEGDDYWTNPLKLQKQIDFLEDNPDFAICFHNVSVVYENDNRQSHLLHREKLQEITAFEDLAKENYIPTPSCVFRNNLFESFPEWMLQVSLGDWILHLLNAEHGKIKYFDEVMAVYRVHSQGEWGNKPIEDRLIYLAEVIKKCCAHFYPRGDRQFTEALTDTYRQLCLSLFSMFEAGNYKDFRHYYREAARAASYIPLRMFLALSVRYALTYLPFSSDIYKNKSQK